VSVDESDIRSDSGAAPSLAVLIVNWNGRELLGECIGSLLGEGYDPLRIVVVDNDSADDSVAFLHDAFPAVEVVCSGANLRWAGGNNAGLRHMAEVGGLADYTLLLNNDTVVPEGSLRCLVEALDADPDAWIATPRICYADQPGAIWYDGGQVGRYTGWIHHSGIRQPAGRRPLRNRYVGYGTGCALLLSREAIETLGELDEGYFFYGEDSDYCLRARAAGHRVLHVPKSLILHKVSVSIGGENPRKAYLKSRSHVRLLRKHWPPARWLVLAPCQVLYYAGLAGWHLWGGRHAMARAALQGALDEMSGRRDPEMAGSI